MRSPISLDVLQGLFEEEWQILSSGSGHGEALDIDMRIIP
jgi:hypothetical protein